MTKVITFWSANGGVGKSTMAANTALNTALKNPAKRVLLMDFNLFNPDLVYHLGVDAEKIEMPLEMFAIKKITHDSVSSHLLRPTKATNLWFLPGLKDLNNFEKLKIYDFDMIIEHIKASNKYDYVFIDTSCALNVDATFSAINKCDLLCVVGEPTYMSVKNIRGIMDSIISKILIHDKVLYLFNKMNKDYVAKAEIDYTFGEENVLTVNYSKFFPISLNDNDVFLYKNTKDSKMIKKQLDAITEFVTREVVTE